MKKFIPFSLAQLIPKVYFGTAHARIYLSADLIGINCPTGMSALMRKQPLDEAGGLEAFADYLAEDFFFAKSLTDRSVNHGKDAGFLSSQELLFFPFCLSIHQSFLSFEFTYNFD